MRLEGVIRYREIEGGVWVLEGDDGQTYELAGGDRKLKRDGARVEVEGELQVETMTLAMVGRVFAVRRYRFL